MGTSTPSVKMSKLDMVRKFWHKSYDLEAHEKIHTLSERPAKVPRAIRPGAMNKKKSKKARAKK